MSYARPIDGMRALANGRQIWHCDCCHREDVWQSGWMNYGSILMEDTCPADMLTGCSPACVDVLKQMLKDKEITLPSIKWRGYAVKLVKARRGY
ncbi:MAG: hypothetical protein HY323_07095 [Betaproteobacteria bacterium]|nr:hypothetical protein [Betaproteobacteria bacterium]